MPLVVKAPLATRDISLGKKSKVSWSGIQRMGPCVPRYVITGCSATLGVTSARAVLDATRATVKREVKDTIVRDL